VDAKVGAGTTAMNGAAIQIIHVDADLIVANKPAGLLAVPGRGPDKQDCLSARVQREWPDALVVHRLDMDTSGLIVFARGAENQRQLSMDFAARRVHKRYIARVAGRLCGDDWQTIDLPLIVDWPNRPRSKVDHDIGKPSQTHWRARSYDTERNTTDVELAPVTGRSHQLRVHLAALGHPILGDPLYAPEYPAARMLLHAAELTLRHPAHEAPQRYISQAPF
jgi:tRNA pseudouridine32 synthase/23S rRNA pseudouridine746 synthase